VATLEGNISRITFTHRYKILTEIALGLPVVSLACLELLSENGTCPTLKRLGGFK